MTINGINGVTAQTGQPGINPAEDSYSRTIKNQIANAQKQLQELSSRDDVTPEEKMKKRQEIQREISSLNMQLRQHQVEQRKEKQQAKDTSADKTADRAKNAAKPKTGNNNPGLSQASMTAMLSADNSLRQAKAQGSTASKMEGKAGVLKAEIKLDAGRGSSVEKKKEELADVEQKAQDAAASQLSTLADANKALKDAAEADSSTEKQDRAEEADKSGKAETAGEAGKSGKAETAGEAGKAEKHGTAEEADSRNAAVGQDFPDTTSADPAARQQTAYTPVDIRL